jgi:hypothetical protein
MSPRPSSNNEAPREMTSKRYVNCRHPIYKNNKCTGNVKLFGAT